MKRIGIIGMSLVAIVAFGAMASAGAQAAEIASCVKAARVTIEYEKRGRKGNTEEKKAIAEGKYKNKSCTEPAPENTGRHPGYTGPEGKYERGAAGARFSAKSVKTLKPKFELANGQVVECASSGSEGEWTGPKTGTQTIIFKGCALVTDNVSGEDCTSNGMGAGEIETAPLALTLVSYPEELVQEYIGPQNEVESSEPYAYEPGKVFVESSPQAGHPYDAEFECGAAASFRFSGAVAGHVKSTFNAMNKTMVWYVGPGAPGVQDLRAEFSGNGGASYEPFGGARESYEVAAKDRAKLEVIEPLD